MGIAIQYNNFGEAGDESTTVTVVPGSIQKV